MLENPDVRAGFEPDSRRRRLSGFRRRRRAVVGAIIAGAGVGAAVPAVPVVATSFLARTGIFGDPSPSTQVDDTEWFDPGADGASQVVIDSFPDCLMLPPGMPKNAAIADTARLMGGMGAGVPGQAVVQEGYIMQVYGTFGICAWIDVWFTAHAASNTETEALATAWNNNFDSHRAVSSSASIRERTTATLCAACSP